jgi:hypothetical protein
MVRVRRGWAGDGSGAGRRRSARVGTITFLIPVGRGDSDNLCHDQMNVGTIPP